MGKKSDPYGVTPAYLAWKRARIARFCLVSTLRHPRSGRPCVSGCVSSWVKFVEDAWQERHGPPKTNKTQ